MASDPRYCARRGEGERHDRRRHSGIRGDGPLDRRVQRAFRVTPRELVGDRYTDALGIERIVPAATREAFIAALAVPESTSIAGPTRVLREGDPLAIDITLAAEHWDEDVLWTLSDDRGTVKAGTVPLRDTPVVRFVQRGGTTFDTRRVTFPFTAASSAYRATLDVRTYGHAGIDIVVAPRAPICRPGRRACGASPCSST